MALTMLVISVRALATAAARLALPSAGRIIAARMPMIEMTTSSSINVNPRHVCSPRFSVSELRMQPKGAQRRAGVAPAPGGEADGRAVITLRLARSLGRRDARPTFQRREKSEANSVQ